MPIEFGCSGCDARHSVVDSAAGRRVRCGRCRVLLTVPALAPTASTPPASLVPAKPPNRKPGLPVAVVVAPPPPTASQAGPESNEEPQEVFPEAAPPQRPRTVVGSTRSRPRAPKPKPFPVVRVLLAIGLVFGLLLVGAGYAAWRLTSAPAEWRQHQSANGGFAVELPAAPRDDMAGRVGLPARPGTTAEGTLRRKVTFAIVWSDLPGRHEMSTDEQALGEIVQGMRREFGRNSGADSARITADGSTAREMVVTIAGEGTYVLRVVLVETRLYIVAAGGPTSDRDDPEVRRFLDSFRVTDERLKTARKQRLDDATRGARELEERHRAMIRKFEEDHRDAEETRRREAEAARVREEAEQRRLAAEAERAVEAERKRRAAAQAESDKFRAAQSGVSAPDPTTLPGLKLYLSFDEAKERVLPVWPKEKIASKADLDLGPGVRGQALYFSKQSTTLPVPTGLLPTEVLRGPGTVAGWVKARKPYAVDLVRTTSTKSTVHDLSRVGVARQTSWRFAAYAWVPVPDTHWRDRFPGEPYPNGISAECPDDELWHHLALVRYGDTDRDRVVLYVDGAAVAEHRFPGADPGLKELFFGFVTANQYQTDREQMRLDQDLPIAAIDELCLFGRALRPEDVRYLAGKGQAPKPPVVPPVVPPAPGLKVELKTFEKINANAGVAFDLERNVVWAVSSPMSHWGKKTPFGGPDPEQAYLLKYSYPDFKLEALWALPPYQLRRGQEMLATGGPPALDVKNNRIYFLMDHICSHSESLQEPYFGYGEFHRFDLDKLPKFGTEKTVLEPAAVMKARGAGHRTGPAVVSADGEWLYFADPSGGKGAYDAAVTRVPADLSNPEPITVPGSSAWGQELWLSPDGKTLRVVQGGKVARGSGVGESGILEVDTQNWKAGTVRDVRGVKWARDGTEGRDGRWPAPIAVHPDGRAFTVLREGVVETIHTGDKVVMRTRPDARVPSAFLAVSADGRYLIAADTSGINSLTVYDARPNPPELGPLASMDGTIDRRVGGPFVVSPDGQFVVFRSGQVVRVDDGSVVTRKKTQTVPAPREKQPAGSPREVAPAPRAK